MGQENRILKKKLSNVNKVAEVKEELTNALMNNIKHEQPIKSLKEQLSKNFSHKLSSRNPEHLNVTLESNDNKIIQAHKIIEIL